MKINGSMFPLFLTSVGVAGIMGVTLHIVVADSGILPFPAGILGEWALPVIGGTVMGVAASVLMSRFGAWSAREATFACASCGAVVHEGWRLCPDCGYMLDEGRSA